MRAPPKCLADQRDEQETLRSRPPDSWPFDVPQPTYKQPRKKINEHERHKPRALSFFFFFPFFILPGLENSVHLHFRSFLNQNQKTILKATTSIREQ